LAWSPLLERIGPEKESKNNNRRLVQERHATLNRRMLPYERKKP
jgi:hypothetical protein